MVLFMFSGKIFVRNAKNDPKPLNERNGRKSKRLQNRKMPKSPGIAWKVAFWIFEMAKLSLFKRIDLKSCPFIHRQELFHMDSVFNSIAIRDFFWKTNLTFSQLSKHFTQSKSEIAIWSPHQAASIGKTIWNMSSKLYSWRLPAHPYFWPISA